MSTTTAQPPPSIGGFFKGRRTADALDLIEANPLAYTLAAVIAIRARWSPGIGAHGLQEGEAFLGDHRRCGMTRQEYRTAIEHLKKWHFATFKPTNKGTVAKLIDTRLFDVSTVVGNQQNNQQATNKQPLTKIGKKEEGKELKLGTADRIALEGKIKLQKERVETLRSRCGDRLEVQENPGLIEQRKQAEALLTDLENRLLEA